MLDSLQGIRWQPLLIGAALVILLAVLAWWRWRPRR
jgi:hypothetical protein